MRERTKTTQKNTVVSTIQEEEIDSKIPKLKKVVLNPVEILDWNGIKKSFAQEKNIWRNLDGRASWRDMQEVQEDFRDKDDFKQFERILQEKIDEGKKNNRVLGTLGWPVAQVSALQESQEERVDEDAKMMQEINQLRQKTGVTERENEQIDRQLTAVEASLKQQEVIFSEYNEKIKAKKSEYSVFMEKLDQQQDLYRRRQKQLDRELETLHEVQEELAFLFNASSRKMTSNSQFLDYIKSLEGKDTLKHLKQRLNLETTKQPRKKPQEKQPLDEEPAEQQAENEALNIKTFKDILKSVLNKEGK